MRSKRTLSKRGLASLRLLASLRDNFLNKPVSRKDAKRRKDASCGTQNLSFIPQRHHRINLRRAACRDETGCQSHSCQSD